MQYPLDSLPNQPEWFAPAGIHRYQWGAPMDVIRKCARHVTPPAGHDAVIRNVWRDLVLPELAAARLMKSS